MIRKVEEFIQKYKMIEAGDTVVVGVSGGADSVCMLLLLQEYRKKISFRLLVVHLNHKIRPEAAEDALYVERLCTKMDIPFFLFEENVEELASKEGLSVEEAGRKIRYALFQEVLEKEAAEHGKIAVAHHADDCAETMLFHLFRGAGLKGLSSIQPVRGHVIRPILFLERKEIEAYLKDREIPWCHDATNEEDHYTRNKIRHHIVAYAEKEICHGASAHIFSAAQIISEAEEYIARQTALAIEQTVVFSSEQAEQGKIACIHTTSFLEQDSFIQKNIVLTCLQELTVTRKDITATHISDIQMLFQKQVGKQIRLPYGFEAIKDYESVIIRKRRAEEVQSTPQFVELDITKKMKIDCLGTIEFAVFDYQGSQQIEEKTYTKCFDYDKIVHCLVFRNRQSGDFLTINKNLQKKTVKQYMIEEKIAREVRENMPLLADDHHILWIPGYRISTYYKITEQTKRILQIRIIGGVNDGRED